MKQLSLLLFSLVITFALHGQTTKTVAVTAGKLNTLLTAAELETVTQLTLTGTIDARDFKTMRDLMPVLSDIDLRETDIEAYSGTSGTGYLEDYAANEVPLFAFLNDMTGGKPTLRTIRLPISATRINDSAFEACTSLTLAELPPLLETLGQTVFHGCTALTSVTLPASIKTMEYAVFGMCSNLKSVVLPPTLTAIPPGTFWRCSSLTDVDIPSTVTSIGWQAFFNCTSLETLHLPSAVTFIDWRAFSGCTSLETLVLPSSLTVLGESAFEGCLQWTGPLDLPAGISIIENRTFYNCQGLTSVTLPPSVIKIGESAFEGCTALSGPLAFPSSIDSIGKRAFYNCPGLTGTLALPFRLTAIENNSFTGCRSFTSLIIPATVTTIGSGAFKGCSALTTVTTHTAFPIPLEEVMGVFEGVDRANATLQVPFGTRELYASANVWKAFATITEEALGISLSSSSLIFPASASDSTLRLEANVEWRAVADQSWLSVDPSSGSSSQELTISADANEGPADREAVITITAEGFDPQVLRVSQTGRPATLSVTPGSLSAALSNEVKHSVTSLTLTGTMDARDFRTIRQEMPNLANLDISEVTIVAFTDSTYGHRILYPANTIPANISDMVDQAYTNYSLAHRTRLTTIRLPYTLTDIAFEAFRGCTNLTTVALPPTLKEIRLRAFMDCVKLKAVVMPSSLNFLGIESFMGCSSLAEVVLSSRLTTISASTFNGCKALKAIEFPPSITTIEDAAFALCTQLQHIEIPSTLKKISNGVFAGCTNLTSVTIPSSVTTIGAMAFKSCTSLTKVILPASVITIMYEAFSNCIQLEAIYLYNPRPVSLHNPFDQPTFENVDKTRCILFVPQGSAELYANTFGWKEFTRIVEMSEFKLSPNQVSMAPGATTAEVELITTLPWTAVPDQPWLRVSPSSGNTYSILTLTMEANPTVSERQATVVFTVADTLVQEVHVVQEPMIVAVEITAGNLIQVLKEGNLLEAKHLSLSGQMDARDFRVLRDSMPHLAVLDLREVSIVAYEGTAGTHSILTQYPANKVPALAFYNGMRNQGSTSLRSILLPSSTIAIGERAFSDCSVLEHVDIPATVTTIEDWAFFTTPALQSLVLPTSLTALETYVLAYSGLTAVVIPPSVTTIEDGVFDSCQELVSVEIPPSVTSMGTNVFRSCLALQSVTLPASLSVIPYNTFSYCTSLSSVHIPASVTNILGGAFHLCESLATISIPASVTYIQGEAFASCTGLRSIYSYSAVPPVLEGSYANGSINTDECVLYVPQGSREQYATAAGWKEFRNIVEMEVFSISPQTIILEAIQSTAEGALTTALAWTAITDQDWLTVSPASGVGNAALQFTVTSNETFIPRVGEVTIRVGSFTQGIIVTQEAMPRTIELTPGMLASVLNAEELASIRNLTITGEMDVRDFWAIRDLMPKLAVLDMSGARIVAYENEAEVLFGADIVPPDAFIGTSSLTSVKLPSTITSIEYNAFRACKKLAYMEIPDGVTYIGHFAFMDCEALEWISIPATVTSMGSNTIERCPSLKAIYLYAVQPPVLNAAQDNFDSIDKNTCILYVPQGSKSLYETAPHWNKFIHIVEMNGFTLSSDAATLEAGEGSSVSVDLITQSVWSAHSDQSWLKVAPESGTGTRSLVFTALANVDVQARVATITFTAQGFDARTCVVTQHGIITEVAALDKNKATFNCYPNPFTATMAIEIINPSSKAVSVEIYSISGQKIRTLTRALKGQRISLVWKGEDEMGRQAPEGMYLVKVNGMTRKVVKR